MQLIDSAANPCEPEAIQRNAFAARIDYLEPAAMAQLSMPLFARACRIFLDAAYPDSASIPEHKRAYGQMPADAVLADYLCPAATAQGICQKLGDDNYTFRLGCARYANLKMHVQCVAEGHRSHCVFAVDTHDAFSSERAQPPPGHPDAAAWMELQAANRALKEKIESAWEAAGILTHNGLLRAELNAMVATEPPSMQTPSVRN